MMKYSPPYPPIIAKRDSPTKKIGMKTKFIIIFDKKRGEREDKMKKKPVLPLIRRKMKREN
jgi:hypothetical protein